MLYVVMLGGRHPGAKIEVHDVVFAHADSLEAAYPQLRSAWFGAAKGLHVDSWLAVDGVDGYRVELRQERPAAGAPRLYFINLGGYEKQVFGEAHRYLLVVAGNKAEAKALSKKRMQADWLKPHTDALIDVDDCLAIDQVAGAFVHLVQGQHAETVVRSDYLLL
ncbi:MULTISPECIES: DUF1543 domain-containing protein [unclassified Pseudomonas]|uniref:DUF1543 domain-containing protein n=1 Tax=unclassified Pseudomonas TaxID=196821 RepID=UPI00257F8F63|nr:MULTISPECIES: DUF1543 domain-containing protein [unclassified Pseudomonas]